MHICISLQITTPAPHHKVFTGRMPLLPPNQQRQSTEGKDRPLNNNNNMHSGVSVSYDLMAQYKSVYLYYYY